MEKQITKIKSSDVLSDLFGINSEIDEVAEEISDILNEFNEKNPNYLLRLVDFLDFSFHIDREADCIYTTFFSALVLKIITKIDPSIHLFELSEVDAMYNTGNAEIYLTNLLDELDSSVLGELIKILSKLYCISICI